MVAIFLCKLAFKTLNNWGEIPILNLFNFRLRAFGAGYSIQRQFIQLSFSNSASIGEIWKELEKTKKMSAI
jgi:hypothetical protein